MKLPSIKYFWHELSFLGMKGLDVETAFLQFREIILLNRLVSVLLLLFIFYLPIEIIFNGWDLAIIIISQIFLMSGVLIFNSHKKFNIARWYFFIMSIIVTAPILYITPKEASNHLFLIAVSLIPVVMFKENWKIFLGFGFIFILFYVIAFTRHFVPDVIDVPLETLEFFSYIFNGMLFLILFFLMFYFKKINRDFEVVIQQKSNQLKESNEIISEKNKDITDSINYAKRIQSAILPPEHFIDKFLKDYFILYKPKDIVAGDFYWAEHIGDHFFIAVADCTGHGVPGAMVSVVCSNALNRAVKEFDLTDPGKILDKTSDLVLETFEKSNEEVKDGMDISLLSFKVQSLKFNKEGEANIKPLTLNFEQITWAGANNSLYYIENNELKEIKANKQPIGYSDNRVPFTTHILPHSATAKAEGGTRSLFALFLFTDGYADQFGGEKGKKFKYSNLQKLLLDNSDKNLKTQSEIPALSMVEVLNHEFEKWKGDLEQVDDVCIVGIRI